MMRVRFAPSPTGNLHIGGGRTALFNWLYAQASHGTFILRIEDTDALRSRKEYLEEILGSLTWLGFNWDEIYYQSQRFTIYKEQAQKLVAKGLAYIEKSQEGKEAIIFRVSPQKIKVKDLIRGDIEFDATTIKDQVLIKSDGTPTYNFACVVDDATMHITHVVRGDDHISNTPKQILLYGALGFPVPEFAHLPLILAKEGGRLSKRKGATAISEYRAMGYLPEALVNYLLLLGWSPGGNREIVDIREAVSLFDIKAVNKTAAVLDLDKLDWMNNQYLKRIDAEKLTDELIPLLVEKKYIAQENYDRQYVVSLVQLFKDRLCVLNDFVDWADFFFLDTITVDEEAKKKFLSHDLSKEFRLFIEKLEKLEIFDSIHIEEAFRALVQQLRIQSRALIHPIRVALTGKTVGPGLFEVIYYLGKERTKKRLMRWVTKEEAE
ncbi:MAG: glutamate--tRNA ligase [Candidatus Omnitrophica bacterium]|nr:glutamate--tRNA ligase [Candidatus Omnitrophota bacterium]